MSRATAQRSSQPAARITPAPRSVAPTIQRSPSPSASIAPAPPAVQRGGRADTQGVALPIQASLRVSSPADPAEREATSTAALIARMPAPAAAPPSITTVANPTAQPLVLRRLAQPQPSTAITSASSLILRRQTTASTPGQPQVSAATASQIRGSLAGGSPLSPATRRFMEPRFGANFSRVRIHTDAKAAAFNARLQARAFTLGEHIFFGPGQFNPESAEGRELLAHELTHTIQQGAAPRAQSSSPAPVAQRSPAVAQRLGLSDALDYFADKANLIPGFRMFTIILGVNPINMGRVDRSPGNILRALIEFIPGGALITQALDNHGVFDRISGWVSQQLATLGMVGSSIRQAVTTFLDSLGWSDIFDLGGVWDRAKRIFTEPIQRIISFAGGLVTDILRFIKEAILRPLARLAEGTRGYDLLKAILGEDPVTGEAVPRTAETLIGGFMKLIGQEEVWQNIQRSRAIPRAWAWFQGAMGDLMGFVRQIPGTFVAAFQSLVIADIILVPRAFAKIASVFGSFIGRFISWAGNTVWDLLQIIFEVVAPGAIVYIRRAAGAFRTILRNPIGFVGNLVRAGILGFRQFAGNFLTHLRASLIGWLTGSLSGANIYIPQGFNLREIIKFVLSVLGLTWQNIRTKLVRVVGETAVRAMETGFDLVVTLVTQGPAAAWERIQEGITNLREMVMEQVMTFVRDRIVQAAITRLVTSLNPAGAFIQAIIAIYNTVMFFIERLRQIAQVAMSFIDAISAIASGVIASAASRVERTMAGLLTLVISFLARIVGLGRVSDAVVRIVQRIRAPIDRALDRVVTWIRDRARSFMSRVLGGDPNATPEQRLDRASTEAVAAVNRFGGRRVGAAILRPLLGGIRLRHRLTSLDVEAEGGRWSVVAVINPRRRRPTNAETESATSTTAPEAIAAGAMIQIPSPTGGWSIHPYRVRTVTATHLTYEYGGTLPRPASALSSGMSALATRGTSWRPLVVASVPLPEDEIVTLNGGPTGTHTSWSDFTIAKKVLNYRHHIHQFNPPSKDWEHIVEQAGTGEDSVNNLALADRRLNQVDLNHWFGERQPSGTGFPNTGPLTVRQYLDNVGATPEERTRWKMRAYRIFRVSIRSNNHGRGPYQTLG